MNTSEEKNFVSPFIKDIEENKSILLQELGLKKIKDLPVLSWRVTVASRALQIDSVIKVQENTCYEAAFLFYLLKKYGSKTERREGCLAIKPFMEAEALLFYLPEGGRGYGMVPPLISHLFHNFEAGPVILFEYEPDH